MKSLKALLLSFLLLAQTSLTPLALVRAEDPPVEESPAPSESPSPSESPTPSQSPQPSESPEPSQSPTPSESPSPSESPVPTPSPSPTLAPEATPSPSPDVSPEPSPTASPAATATPSAQLTTQPAENLPNSDQSGPSNSDTDKSEPSAATTASSENNSEEAQPDSSPTTNATNSADIPTTATVSATTGDNQSIAPEGDALVVTGDALAQLDLIQIINTLIFQSNLTIISYDVTDPSQELLNLTELSQLPEGVVKYAQSCPTSGCGIQNTSNSAQVVSDLTVIADTGNNTLEAENTELYTGDSAAVANVIQVVNSQFHSSNIVIVVVNILVPWNGDIWLPFFMPMANSAPSQNGSATSSTSNNVANVNSQFNVDANSGGNTQEGGDNYLETGDSAAELYYQLFANVEMYNQMLWQLMVHNQQQWLGQLGMGASPASNTVSPTDSTETQSIPTSPNQSTTQNSQATVDTSLTVQANTGNNTATGSESNTMVTGSSTALANVLQFINTSWFNSQFFIGIVNIVQPWSGDLWIGEPPVIEPEIESPAIGGLQPEIQTTYVEENPGDQTEPIVSEVPHVTLSIDDLNQQAVQAGQQVTIVTRLHNDSGATVHQPILEQNLVDETGKVIGQLFFQLPPLAPGAKAKFSFGMKTPTQAAKGIYTTQLVLREGKSDYMPVSNSVATDFYLMQWIAQVIDNSGLEPTASVLGVQAAEPNMEYPQTNWPWFLTPSMWMLPPLLLALLTLRRLRRKPM